MGIEAKAGMKSLWRHLISNKSSPKPRRTIDWRDKMADKYDASYNRNRSTKRPASQDAGTSYLAMRKAVEEPAGVDLLCLSNQVSVASSGSGRDNVLVERKGNESDDG